MPLSMTGFARQETQQSWGTLSCEIRSVNHRYLEPSMRMPEVLRSTEPLIRDALRKQLSRGKIEINIYLKTDNADQADSELNFSLAQQIIQMAETIQDNLRSPANLNAMEILRWPGVIQAAEIPPEVLTKTTLELFESTLTQLIVARSREGEELAQFIEQRLSAITNNVLEVRKALPQILKHQQEKIETKLAALKVDVDEDRLAQELVYIAQKSDVAEELDRLDAHVTEVRHTLKKQKGPIGRRLDFLMQELNREANTLSSKSMASDTSQIAVDLKVLIEQMREQVQNIE